MDYWVDEALKLKHAASTKSEALALGGGNLVIEDVWVVEDRHR